MPQVPVAQAMAFAAECLRSGQYQQAESIYRQVLQVQPNLPDAWANLGLLLQQTNRLEEAVLCHQRAVRFNPDSPQLLNNLAAALRALRRYGESEQCYRQALQIDPAFADSFNNLGALLKELNRLEEALACYRQALVLAPDHPFAGYNLANTLNLLSRPAEAIDAYRQVIARNPRFFEAHVSLGFLLGIQGRSAEAVEAFQQAVALRPDHAESHYNLGIALGNCQRINEAAQAYHRAIALDPAYADAYTNLGKVLRDQGKLDEAIEVFRKLVALRPERADLHSNLLYTLHYSPAIDPAALHAEHQRWEAAHAKPLYAQIRPHANNRDPGRRLKIGYVSPDLGRHVVGWLIESLLAHHDHTQFHITCYSDLPRPDAQTERLRGFCDAWHNTHALSDEQLADLIRQDQVDILVDLASHTANNRLLTFARKPAPVQVTYLAYPGSAGLSVIDYYLTDRYLNPVASSQRSVVSSQHGNSLSTDYRLLTTDYSPADDCSPADAHETPIPLPHCYWCYTAPADAPPVNDLPALRNNRITFASFNNMVKVNPQVIALWSKVLLAVPQSRLLLVIPGGEQNAHIWQTFEKHSIDRSRVRLLGNQPIEKYWQLHHEVDIALDPFPYTGGVTSLNSLWMGVPFVTLAGDRPVGRSGVSILSNLGLPELIAQTPQEYIQVAARLADNLPRLSEIRRTLRQTMQASPLMDARAFAADAESTYRRMWQAACKSSHRPIVQP